MKMCTALAGPESWFLPFNKGVDDGAGNPPNESGLKTAYLWEDILQKERLSDILENYAQVIREKDAETGKIKEKCICPATISWKRCGHCWLIRLPMKRKALSDSTLRRIGKEQLHHLAGFPTGEYEAGRRTHSTL